MRVLTQQEMILLDEKIRTDLGISQDVLMENAGFSVIEIISTKVTDYQSKNFLILCGPGNNAGDGFVIARHLIAQGIRTSVLFSKQNSSYTGSSLKNLDVLKEITTPLLYADELSQFELMNLINQSDIIVDALFGVGLTRELNESYFRIVDMVNRSKICCQR